MPPGLTGAVGMDALGHNLEAYCAPGFHPMADGIALEGMRLIRRSLLRAYNQGDDLDARAEMMAASTMGATAFQKGLGAMHSVGHAVGGYFDVHHGTTIAVMMPYVLLMNRPVVEERLVRLARHLGMGDTCEALLDCILGMRRDLGIPHSLADLGVTAADVTRLTEAALADPTAASNPTPLTEENVRQLIEAALSR
jgi:alcohol dehydrogenase